MAVKGVGGYHLLCDATNGAAVQAAGGDAAQRNIEALRAAVHATPEQEAFLASPERPIVLLPKRTHSNLSENIAPDLAEIGCRLPDSPTPSCIMTAPSGGRPTTRCIA